MRRFERVLVISPHADDEVLGCGGLMAAQADAGAEVHVLFLAVDGMRHYGLDGATTYRQRLDEIEDVRATLGFSYEIAYGDRDLTERLDTLPRRELVDLFERALNERRPDLLLLPSFADYDQDHRAVFAAGFAAARPIAQQFGKWLVPHVFLYEMSKIQWASEPMPRSTAYCDIGAYMERKLEALRGYRSQHRPSPHIRSEESVTALATLRGAEIGVERAEAFGVLRTVL
ncbi:PIG-L family deacetylase [Nonomuraea roseoviolacea subsp. roseoviolacea]|uniref:LmbE family N-acetylglucosaminyl deacetylase n=1 Tax=Nonomuraea roseoviolacea subsp. carminata TaxID=160689 RepID=A0ABT1JW14_9ACTN|nr:PIG-L family deacetylase [Nonomuraea roseoviolacea]MCP2345517.1 LmbE family N-acetylglucosaminyl deacetylase [Nonomuraea roseoviolacea subsp. carminata]